MYASSHKSFSMHYDLWEGWFLKYTLANLYCTKWNEINIFFEKVSDILWAMLRNGWKGIFNCVAGILTLSNNVEKYLCIRFVCLSICPPACVRSNCRRYSSNDFKFIHAVHILYRMDSIKNYEYGIKCSFAEIHKIFPIHFGPLRGGGRSL